MKKYLVILMILFLTGCTCDYEINLDGNNVEEKMTSIIYPSDYETNNQGIDDDNYIDYLLDSDIYPLVNNYNDIYEKNIENIDDGQKLTMQYKYNANDFKSYSYILKNCFDNYEFEYNKGHYYIRLKGKFYCLYNDEVNITLKSSNKIKSCNGKKENGNCKWTINNDNLNDVDIEVEVSSISKTRQNIMIFIAGVIIVIALGFIFYYIVKINNRNSINDI